MAKAVVYALLGAAFVVLLVVGPTSHRHRHHGHLPTLNRRLGNKFRAPIFDPLVAKIERREQEEKTSEPVIVGESLNDSLADVAPYVYEGKYYSQEGRLNITLRLIILFPLLDKEPKDGVVSPLELNSWLRDMAMGRLNYQTRKELDSHDKDRDLTISFKEYFPQFSDEDIEKNDMRHGEAGWWKQQFVNADVDRNGVLSFNELKDFLHPEDCDNEQIKKWLLRDRIERMDSDKDGKLNFVEFSNHAYDLYKNNVEYETPNAQVVSSQHKFLELDINKNKLLEVEELIPILNYLYPGELSYAKFYASYLIHEADDNKDGNLTLEEMMNHEYIFYSTVYDDTHEDFDEDYHDEL